MVNKVIPAILSEAIIFRQTKDIYRKISKITGVNLSSMNQNVYCLCQEIIDGKETIKEVSIPVLRPNANPRASLEKFKTKE